MDDRKYRSYAALKLLTIIFYHNIIAAQLFLFLTLNSNLHLIKINKFDNGL